MYICVSGEHMYICVSGEHMYICVNDTDICVETSSGILSHSSPLSIHELTDYVQMIRSRSALYPNPPPHSEREGQLRVEEYEVVHSNLPGQQTHLIDLQQLQEDVVIAHIVGKPLIKPPSSLRIHFRFRDDTLNTKEKSVVAHTYYACSIRLYHT